MFVLLEFRQSCFCSTRNDIFHRRIYPWSFYILPNLFSVGFETGWLDYYKLVGRDCYKRSRFYIQRRKVDCLVEQQTLFCLFLEESSSQNKP